MNDTHTHDIQSIQENIDDVGYVRSSDPTSPTQDTVPYWFELERERLQESLHIIIEDYPVHDFIKPRLLEIMNQAGFPNSQKTNVKADMTEWNIEAKDISIMHEWISSLIAPKMKNFDEDNSWVKGLNFHNTWFARYNLGDKTTVHMHLPSVFSWVYFLNTPEGSSPLVFPTSGREIEPIEGTLVVFPSCTYHSVPPNGCEGRIVMAGNISWSPDYNSDLRVSKSKYQ